MLRGDKTIIERNRTSMEDKGNNTNQNHSVDSGGRNICTKVRVVLAVLFVLSVISNVIFVIVLVTRQQTSEPPAGMIGPSSTEEQIGSDWRDGLSFLVDYEATDCKYSYCETCITDVLLRQHNVTEPLNCRTEQNIKEKQCWNCSTLLELIKETGSYTEECRDEQVEIRCLSVRKCQLENWCHGGTPVYNSISKTTECQCPRGKKGVRCLEEYSEQYQCECYRHIYPLSGWTTIPWCYEDFTEPPNICREKITDSNDSSIYRRCVCKKSETRDAAAPKCIVKEGD